MNPTSIPRSVQKVRGYRKGTRPAPTRAMRGVTPVDAMIAWTTRPSASMTTIATMDIMMIAACGAGPGR